MMWPASLRPGEQTDPTYFGQENQGVFTSRIDAAIGWARKYSIFQYPFVTACCGMEYMATACSHY